MHEPLLDLGELVLHLDDADVVEDADHALEEGGVAPGERRRGLDELLDHFGLAARREELLHHARGVGLGERRELDRLVSRASVTAPVVAPREHLRPRQAHEEHGRVEPVDEVTEQVDRLVRRVLEVVEDEHDRPARRRRTRGRDGTGLARIDEARAGRVERVGDEEALQHRAAEQAHLLRLGPHRLDERRVHELEVEQLPEEEADVADLPVLEHGGDLGADLRLRGLRVHALDDAEARAEHAREDVVDAAVRPRRSAEHARGAQGAVAVPRQEVPHEARLADARRTEDGDRARLLVLTDAAKRLVQHAELGRAADERRSPIEAGEACRNVAVGHGCADPGMRL